MKTKIMNRREILRKERETVLSYYAENKGDRAKWLTALMDIDDEIEELTENTEDCNDCRT